MKKLILALLFSSALLLITVKTAKADCTTTNNPEFHSLRPYPYYPCQSTVASYANFCGNNLTLQDTITENYPGGGGDCTTTNGVVICSYNVSVNKPISINLSGANLPFMGNTENVKNSQSNIDTTNTDKVNNYVSWYLNGTNNRAEYGGTSSSDGVVNYSGPINKLLPSAILDAQRIQTISNVSQNVNHNQIVVCAQNGKPSPCYKGDGSPAQGTVYRLNDWNDGSLSVLTTFFNWVGTDIWNKRFPPLPWQFTSKILYDKSYSEWKGNSCIIIPVVNKLVCVALPIISNPSSWSNLYSYIPLSSTEDLEGNVKVDSVAGDTTNGTTTVTNVSFSNQTPATLFFAHIQESIGLGSILQNTYVPQGQSKIGNPVEVSNQVSCNPVEVRSNKGDSLVNGSSQISGVLAYDAAFSCTFDAQPPSKYGGFDTYDECMSSCHLSGSSDAYCASICQEQNSTQTCQKTVNIVLSTETNSPKLDDVWSQLVAGPMAIVKRLFPKLGSQIGTLEDIPGSTAITYNGATANTGTLNIPHVGGIDEYFLNGIQTLLRPKGFGENISFGPVTTTTSPGEINCNRSAPESDYTKILDKQALYQFALRWVGGKTGNHVMECYNDTIARAKAAGVNIALSLALWLHESNASNYSLGYVQDFGAYWPETYPGYTAQINEFFRRAKDSIYTKNGSICQGRNDVKDDFMAWALVYQSGKCDPTEPEAKLFYSDMITAIGWVSSCPTPTSPTDMSCP